MSAHRCVLGVLMTALLTVGCGDDGPSVEVDAGPPAVDQCTSSADLAIAVEILEAGLDGGVPDGGSSDGGMIDAGAYPGYLTALAGGIADCAREACINVIFDEGDVHGCTKECLFGRPEANLTDGCIGCFTETVECAVDNCLTECLTGDSPLCTDCRIANCDQRLFTCSGFPDF